MSRPDYLLFDRNTVSLIYGMQTKAVQRMLDFDYCCRRDVPSVAALVDPGKTGSERFSGARRKFSFRFILM